MPAVRDRQRATPADVLPTSVARRELTKTSREFVEKGVDAEPVFFGAHRKPQGVMLSYQRYLQLLDVLDDFAIALEVRRRDRSDQGTRLSLEELIREQGFEPADFGLE